MANLKIDTGPIGMTAECIHVKKPLRNVGGLRFQSRLPRNKFLCFKDHVSLCERSRGHISSDITAYLWFSKRRSAISVLNRLLAVKNSTEERLQSCDHFLAVLDEESSELQNEAEHLKYCLSRLGGTEGPLSSIVRPSLGLCNIYYWI